MPVYKGSSHWVKSPRFEIRVAGLSYKSELQIQATEVEHIAVDLIIHFNSQSTSSGGYTPGWGCRAGGVSAHCPHKAPLGGRPKHHSATPGVQRVGGFLSRLSSVDSYSHCAPVIHCLHSKWDCSASCGSLPNCWRGIVDMGHSNRSAQSVVPGYGRYVPVLHRPQGVSCNF